MKFPSKLILPQAAADAMSSAVDSGRLLHAVLLGGGDEMTRYRTALALANALICGAAGEKPCGRCEVCRAFSALKIRSKKDIGESPAADVYVYPVGNMIDGAKNAKDKAAIIDTVRSIGEKAWLLPASAPYSVFIITDVDRLSAVAQNTLLKNIEEPPPASRFILTAQTNETILPTVLSRVTAYSLGEGAGDAPAAVKRRRELLSSAVSALIKGDEFALEVAMAPLLKDRTRFKAFTDTFGSLCADAALPEGAAHLTELDAERDRMRGAFKTEKLTELYYILRDVSDEAESNINLNLLVCLAAARLAAATALR